MNPRLRTITAASALTLTLVPAAFAAGRAPAGGLRQLPPAIERTVARLDLTPEQQQEIRAILASHKRELTVELRAVGGARQLLFEAIHADPFDEAAIRDAAALVAAAEAELAVTRGVVVSEVRVVLTPEQQAEVEEMLAQARDFVEAVIEVLRARFALLAL